MNFLNSGKGLGLFEEEVRKLAYVDKSLMIQTVCEYAQKSNRYICVTRPRRFGKSTAANMIAAFFEEESAEESRKLFESLEVGKLKTEQMNAAAEGSRMPYCWPLQGKCKVIWINMIKLLTSEIRSYQKFLDTFNRRMLDDISRLYPNLVGPDTTVEMALTETGDKFIFVIDEWDAIFEEKFMSPHDKEEYLKLLKGLLKDSEYVRFVYMTGILPIAKYSSGSPLNMFDEFSAFQDDVFYPFFGLTRDEIGKLMLKRGIVSPSLEELSFWYDGYFRGTDQECVYNPKAVSTALSHGRCRGYWTGTGPMDEVRNFIQHNVQDLREDVIRMVGGETLKIRLTGFSAEREQENSRNEILSTMVVYGFLTYHDGELRIPNHELMLKFREALASQSMGLKQTLDESQKLVKATLNRDRLEIARLFEELHDEKIPFFQYNDENSLACVVVVGYLAALDQYRISREEKAGKGFVDFCFTPMRKEDLPIILELEYNHSAKNAIQNILKKDYLMRYREYPSVLLVGINYSEKTKKHTCLTELVHRED